MFNIPLKYYVFLTVSSVVTLSIAASDSYETDSQKPGNAFQTYKSYTSCRYYDHRFRHHFQVYGTKIIQNLSHPFRHEETETVTGNTVYVLYITVGNVEIKTKRTDS